MGVREELSLLVELGTLDHRARLVQAQKGERSKKFDSLEKELDVLRGQEAGLAQKVEQVTAQRKKAEADLANERGNLRKWESRADKIKGEREYTALMSEIGGLKKTIAKLEEESKLFSQGFHEKTKEYEALKEAIATAQTSAEQERLSMQEDIASFDGEVEQFKIARSALIQKIPVILVRRYEQIAARRQGVGLAVIKREVCQSCMRTVPPELFMRIVKGEVIEQCPSCQRILVTEDLSITEQPI